MLDVDVEQGIKLDNTSGESLSIFSAPLTYIKNHEVKTTAHNIMD